MGWPSPMMTSMWRKSAECFDFRASRSVSRRRRLGTLRSGDGPTARQNPSRLEVHQVRAGGPALRSSGRTLQHLPLQGSPICRPAAHGPTHRGGQHLRRWHPQHGRLRLAPNHRRALVQRQRPRPMGDDVPPEEINVASGPGQHFGYPFIHGSDIPDPKVRQRCTAIGIHAPAAGNPSPRRRPRLGLPHSRPVPRPDIAAHCSSRSTAHGTVPPRLATESAW